MRGLFLAKICLSVCKSWAGFFPNPVTLVSGVAGLTVLDASLVSIGLFISVCMVVGTMLCARYVGNGC